MDKKLKCVMRPEDAVPLLKIVEHCRIEILALQDKFSLLAGIVAAAPTAPAQTSSSDDDHHSGSTDVPEEPNPVRRGCDGPLPASSPCGWDPFLAGKPLGVDVCGPAAGDVVLVRGLLDAKNAVLYNHRIGVINMPVGDGSRFAVRFAPDVPLVSIRQSNLVLMPRCPNCLAGIGQRSYCANCHFGLHSDGGAFALARPNALPRIDNDSSVYMMADHAGLRFAGTDGTTKSNFVATDLMMDESPPAPLAGVRAAGVSYSSSRNHSKDDSSSAPAPSRATCSPAESVCFVAACPPDRPLH
jgi:hypothetical protein